MSTIILLNGSLAGTAPNSTVVGGLSADNIVSTGTLAEARISGQSNNDTITINLQGSASSIRGGTTINGNDGLDFIRVLNTINRSSTQIENSSIWGGLENDTIEIGNGTAAVIALNEGSAVEGNAGNDNITIRASYNKAYINGNEDRDNIVIETTNQGTGGIVDTTVLGGAGNDTVRLTVFRPESANGLFLNGEAGNDQIQIFQRGDINFSTIRGGIGDDTIFDAAVPYSINTVFINGNEGVDNINLLGVFNSNNSTIRGGQDNDFVDVVFGGAVTGNVINGNQGNDDLGITFNGETVSTTTVYGGIGNDTIVVAGNAIGNVVVAGNEGADQLTGRAGGAGTNEVTEFAYSYGDTVITETGTGRDTITNLTTDDIISLSDAPIIAIDLLASGDLANFVQQASTLAANTVAIWNGTGANAGNAFMFISDGGGLNSDDLLIQLSGKTGVDASDFIISGNTLTYA